jgi:hypothetical protein
MKIKAGLYLILLLVVPGCSNKSNKMKDKDAVYNVARTETPIIIDANWDKPVWQKIHPLDIDKPMGEKAKFTPEVQAKMAYDDDYIYVIYRVNDRYVRAVVKDINGKVYEESAVEFFFSPDPSYPNRYFNIEINCIGTPLMHYNDYSPTEKKSHNTPLTTEEIQQLKIAHSLPDLVDNEISGPVTWTLECRIPVSMLEKYSKINYPKAGVEWKANFYKIAEQGSNIHFLTWSVIDNPVPNFHLPRFFGTIKFQ